MTDTNTEAPRSVRLALRVTPEQYDRLVQLAIEKGFVGGPGRPPGAPNVSLAVRHLMGEADQVLADNDLSLEWDRNPG